MNESPMKTLELMASIKPMYLSWIMMIVVSKERIDVCIFGVFKERICCKKKRKKEKEKSNPIYM